MISPLTVNYDLQAICNYTKANAFSLASASLDNSELINIAYDDITSFRNATFSDLTVLWNDSQSEYAKARYSVKYRMALYVNAIKNSLNSYLDLIDTVTSSIDSNSLILAAFNGEILFVLTPLSLLYSNVSRADHKEFKFLNPNRQPGDDKYVTKTCLMEQVHASDFLEEYVIDVANYITSSSKDIELTISWYRIDANTGSSSSSIQNTIYSTDIFTIEHNIVQYIDADICAISNTIALTFEVLLQLYNFYLTLSRVYTIKISLEYIVLYIGTRESIAVVNTINVGNELSDPNDSWAKALLVLLINNSEYDVSYSPFSVIYFPTLQLNIEILDGDNSVNFVGNTLTKLYTIKNLFNVVNGNFANIDRTYENSSSGSNGIFSYFINVNDSKEILSYSDFIQQYFGSFEEGNIISLVQLLTAVDNIFSSWLNSINCITINIQMCHLNCHTNYVETRQDRWVCVCGQWTKDTSTTSSNVKIPKSGTTFYGDSDGDGDND